MSADKEEHLNRLKALLIEKQATRPIAIVVGGDRVTTKLNIILNFVDKVDKIFIGGLAVFTFQQALGHHVGDSFVAEEAVETAKQIIALAKEKNVALIIAPDTVALPTNILRERVEVEMMKNKSLQLRESVSLFYRHSDVHQRARRRSKGNQDRLTHFLSQQPGEDHQRPR